MVCMLGAFTAPAAASTDIQGPAEDLQLRLENASVREVLNALSGKFKLTYSLPANIGRQLTGRYSGTLNQVLARILDGNDYIVEVSDDAIKIVVWSGKSAPSAAAAVSASKEDQRPSLLVPASAPPQPLANPAPPPSVPPLTSYLTMTGPSTVGLGNSTP